MLILMDSMNLRKEMVLTQLLEAKPKIEFNYEYLYESSDLGRVKEWISSNKYLDYRHR
jgi:hypothetical protein